MYVLARGQLCGRGPSSGGAGSFPPPARFAKRRWPAVRRIRSCSSPAVRKFSAGVFPCLARQHSPQSDAGGRSRRNIACKVEPSRCIECLHRSDHDASAGGAVGRMPRSPAPEQLNIALAVFPDEAASYDGFVADFESQNHVRVNVLAQTYTDILQAMRVQAASRGSLDLVELDLAMLGEAHEYAQPLDPMVSPSARALFSNQAWNAATIDRRLYFIPHRLMWQAMIYNRVEVPNPPATWSELARFAREHPGKLALKGARYEGAICDVCPSCGPRAGANARRIRRDRSARSTSSGNSRPT